MRFIVKTIVTVFIINLAAGCFAEPKTAEQLQEQVTKARVQVEQTRKRVKQAKTGIARVAPTERAHSFGSSVIRRSDSLFQPENTILIIPSRQINEEHSKAILEDMTIMSQILEDKLKGLTRSSNWRSPWGREPIQGFYLDGYGALFSIKVDFPLSPPVETKEKEAEKSDDEVWENAKKQITQQTRKTHFGSFLSSSKHKPKYDANKVEDLKEKLVEALKHTTNIRNLAASDSIILTVAGTDYLDNRRPSVGIAIIQPHEENNAIRFNTNVEPNGSFFPSPKVITIRAKKADATAFYKGEIDIEKFKEKIKILTN